MLQGLSISGSKKLSERLANSPYVRTLFGQEGKDIFSLRTKVAADVTKYGMNDLHIK